MARFLDVHSMKGLNEDTLMALQKSSEDEFKVKHLNIMYNPEVDKCFCLLEAPSLEAVEKNHEKLGIRCDWITEVRQHPKNLYIKP
jgi:uncharacterized protein DUF4242